MVGLNNKLYKMQSTNIEILITLLFTFRSLWNERYLYSVTSAAHRQVYVQTKRDQLVNRKKKSHLSIENKLLIYKVVINPIWSYGIELWGCASKFNIVVMQRSQPKTITAIANAPWYVRNRTLHTDFNIS